MKRLPLKTFQKQQANNKDGQVQQLLGQILGDCHDSAPKPDHRPHQFPWQI